MSVGILSGTVTAVFFVGFLVSGFLSVVLFVYTVRNHRDRPVGRAFAVLAGALAVWAFGYAARMASPALERKLVWHAVAFLGILTVPPALLVFALLYTRSDGVVTPRFVAGVSLVPVLSWVALLTNGIHRLFYTTTRRYLSDAVPILMTDVGPLFWVQAAYGWLLTFISLGLLAQYAVTSNHLYRSQSVALLLGAGLPWVTNVLFLLGIRAHPVLDPTPLAIAVTLVAFWAAVFRTDFLKVVPTAREIVFNTIDVPVFVLDKGDRLIDVNTPARERFGVTDDAIGLAASSALPDPLWESVQTHDESGEWEYRHATGTAERIYLVCRRPITSSRGRRRGSVLTLTDITEQKRQQQRLEEFSSVVSHDLRNPLQLAQGRLTLVREEFEHEHFETIETAHERMETLIDDLLALARQGEAIEDPDPVDVAALAEASWRTVETADATLVIETERTIMADRNRLRQLLENLFRNAVEHAGDDVTVTVGTVDDGFYVADDGPGIPADEHTDVFDAGYSTTDGGTGFGLKIVREIAQSHGWDIRVTDSEAGGVRFDITGVELVAS